MASATRSDDRGTTGYRHARYAQSFAGLGQPRELPNCGGWLIERAIPGSEFRDAMGCYPLFDCQSWAGLPLDFAGLSDSLVAVSLVTNPFADVAEADLRQWFDVVMPYKLHQVTDLARSVDGIVLGQHRRNVRKALRRVDVSVCPEPLEHIDEWCRLYGRLTERHRITGLRVFSRDLFEKQLAVPGLTMLRASIDDETVGLHLWYECGDVAYGHLGATSDRGYEHMAAYALYWQALNYFRERVRWLELGASAGPSGTQAGDGLSRFKAGWATGSRATFVCGRVLRPAAYAELAMKTGTNDSAYFPCYRTGEFSSPDMRLAQERG